MVPMTVMQTPPALAVQPVVPNAYPAAITPVTRTIVSRPTTALVSTIRQPIGNVIYENPVLTTRPLSSVRFNGGTQFINGGLPVASAGYNGGYNGGFNGGFNGGLNGGGFNGGGYSGGYSSGQSVNGNLLGLASFVDNSPPQVINQVIEKIPVTTTVMDGISSTTAVPPQYTVTDNMTGALSYLNFPFGADNNI